MDIVVFHVGLNDLRKGRPVGRVVDDIQACLSEAKHKFPNAYIGYSGLLHIGNSVDLNQRISYMNGRMNMYCTPCDAYVYIEHRQLQSADYMYEDDVHINNSSGVRSFVRDIHKALSTLHRGSRAPTQKRIDHIRNQHPILRITGHMPPNTQVVVRQQMAPPPRENVWSNGPPSFVIKPNNQTHLPVSPAQDTPRHQSPSNTDGRLDMNLNVPGGMPHISTSNHGTAGKVQVDGADINNMNKDTLLRMLIMNFLQNT